MISRNNHKQKKIHQRIKIETFTFEWSYWYVKIETKVEKNKIRYYINKWKKKSEPGKWGKWEVGFDEEST